MPYETRQDLIRELEEIRGSRVVTYVTGDRPQGGPALDLALPVEPTVVPVIHEALRGIGKTDAIDLFLYTRGGQVDSVWPIVSLFREYVKVRFAALVPFRAHSAGTLMLLGVDEIVMCEAAELTSIDPTTGTDFNPVDEIQKGKRKAISVEDVAAYFSLVRENDKIGLTDPVHILEVFKQLAQQVHPLALGHVQRVHTQIRLLAGRLLRASSHKYTEERIEKIIATLTEKLYSHTQAVNRQDARQLLGKSVVFPEGRQDSGIWELFEAYSSALDLRVPHNILADLGDDQQTRRKHPRGFVETATSSWVFESETQITASSKASDNAIYQRKGKEPAKGHRPKQARIAHLYIRVAS